MRRRRDVALALVAVLMAGVVLWWAFARVTTVSRAEALSMCGRGEVSVVGLGNSESLSVVDAVHGWRLCTVTSSAPISSAELRAPLSVVWGVHDGGLDSPLLLLVHANAPTTSVVVTAASSQSTVLSHRGGFEVLRLAGVQWPTSDTPKDRLALGQVLAFNARGIEVSAQPFTWCSNLASGPPGAGC